MTFFTLPRPVSFSEICRERIGHAASMYTAQFSEWRRRARSRRELRQLSDVDLRDIGWTRADAAAETRKPFWQQ